MAEAVDQGLVRDYKYDYAPAAKGAEGKTDEVLECLTLKDESDATRSYAV